MKKNSLIKSGFGWLLSGTQVAFDGLSSARQIVDFTPSPWAKYAACGATIVEGEIYRKNIVEGFSRFSLLSDKTLRKYLIIEKVESDLQKINVCAKELKENIINFFNKIKNCEIGNYALNQEEKNFLDENVFDKVSFSLTKTNREKLYDFFEDLKTKRDGTSRFIIIDHIVEFNELNRRYQTLINKTDLRSFLENYKANLKYLEQTESTHGNASHIEQAEKNLKLLRKLLVKSVIESETCDLLNNETSFPTGFINELKEDISKKTIKLWPLRFGMLFSLGVGAAVGVITFYTFPPVLMSIGLTSLTILSAVIWPLAILAAISYAILIYNTITELILNETLSNWWKKLNREIDQKYNGQLNILKYICLIIGKSLSQFFGKLINWFKFQEKESYFSYIFRMILSAAVLVFGIIAALTTGYTAFIQLQNYVSLAVCVTTALPLMLSDLLFTLKNSFETVGLLTGISINNLLDPIKEAYKKFIKQISTENHLQRLLHILRIPLRIMLSVLKLLIFGFHVFFISVASDRFFNFPCWLTVFFAAGSELLTDICPLFGNDQSTHHDHDHGGIFNWINKIIFIIPATMLGILNCLFSQLNHLESSNNAILTLWGAIKQEWEQFEIMHDHDASSSNEPAPKLPKEVVLQRAIHICDKQINRLNNVFFNTSLAKEKVKIFINYKQQLLQNNQTDSNNNISDSEKNKLNERRYGFFTRGNPESMQKIEKIQVSISEINDNNHFSSNGRQSGLFE